MQLIKEIWHKLSRNGLRDDEGVFGHREIIFLNKILIVSPIIIALLIPIEIVLNGFELVPLELIFIVLMIIPSIIQRYRYFWFARIYILLIGNLFIMVAGTLVGKGVNNHVSLIPLMLFGMILFKTTRDRLLVFFISLFFYLTLKYLLEVVPPVYNISDINKEKFTLIFYVMTLLLTFLLGYYFLGINSDYEKIIVTQNESITIKNKEITDSITYAKRIQEAKLPNKENFYTSFPQSFILFKPKDIVSGDFYYFHTTQQLTFIAAADCTGHGVPGAFMCMIGSEKLENSVSQNTDTSNILMQLNKGIKTSLRQSNNNESTRDGMDIALCSIDKENGILKFAGANRPLWIIRKGQSAIEEIKATKKAIGGLTENDTTFESHELKLQQGDTFYIFTDGYADQFGGKSGKKLMTKKFKEILLDIKNKTMQEQEKYLNDFIEEWKAGTEQVDDILVIGIRL